MAPRLNLKCPSPPSDTTSLLVNPSNTLKPLKISLKISPAKHKSQPFRRASIVDLDVNELSALEARDEKKRKLEEDIECLVEKKRRKLDEETAESRKGPPEGYRARAFSTFRGKGIAPAQRCPTQVEATIHHFQVVRTSMELLKVVLHSMISTIFFTRELLPQTSFGVRALPICFAHETFCFEEHFMNGSIIPVKRFPVQLREGEIMVMERGKDRLTNSIIGCLVKDTIFAKFLLQRKLLGLQFIVCKSKYNRTEVYETYTISIDYKVKRGPSDREGKKLDFQNSKKDLKCSLEVQKAIIAMFRRMVVEIGKSTLPNSRSLAVHIFHTPLTVNTMSDDSFKRSWTEHLSLPKIPGWHRQTVHSEFIDTGFYGARLSVTYLDPPMMTNTLNRVPEPMPAQVHFTNHRNKGADVQWEHGLSWVKKEVAKRAVAKKAARERAPGKAKEGTISVDDCVHDEEASSTDQIDVAPGPSSKFPRTTTKRRFDPDLLQRADWFTLALSYNILTPSQHYDINGSSPSKTTFS
ncbi:hypothetical protein F1880_004429 [Penicillium rolfsii]|nr:hypothetical protein F1880_004429 [Penicillium rolfsii]